ncbi:MAG TPA: fibronectin type III domain-containing protein, partial [Myxococcota bacterium]|nr:fibronectin type III domain-containing protein [Myxococcota bacterium]
ITVKWSPVDDSSDSTIEYFVYWDDSSFSNSTKNNVSVAGPMSGSSYQITSLDNDTEYFYAVSSVDENDNESVLSAVSSAMPINVSDFWEHYRQSGGTEDGGFCFIATAAWGSYMAPEVRALRLFRDTYLMTNGLGRAFVRLYYATSPALADAISSSPALRASARIVLAPAVLMARVMTSMPGLTGPLAVAVFGVLLTFVFGVAVRSRRRS